MVDSGASPALFKNQVAPHKTTFFPQINNTIFCAPVLPSFFFCSFSKLSSIRFSIRFPNFQNVTVPSSWSKATRRSFRRLSKGWPVPQMLQAFDCRPRCTMHSNAWFEELRALFWQWRKMCPGKFLQDSCLNSSIFLEFLKTNAQTSDPTHPFGSLPGLGRPGRQMEGIPRCASRNSHSTRGRHR